MEYLPAMQLFTMTTSCCYGYDPLCSQRVLSLGDVIHGVIIHLPWLQTRWLLQVSFWCFFSHYPTILLRTLCILTCFCLIQCLLWKCHALCFVTFPYKEQRCWSRLKLWHLFFSFFDIFTEYSMLLIEMSLIFKHVYSHLSALWLYWKSVILQVIFLSFRCMSVT